MQIFFSISFNLFVLKAFPVAFTKSAEHLGSNSSILEAMNMTVAPTNWKSDLARFFYFCRNLSQRLTEMWKVYINIKVPLFWVHIHKILASSIQPSGLSSSTWDLVDIVLCTLGSLCKLAVLHPGKQEILHRSFGLFESFLIRKVPIALGSLSASQLAFLWARLSSLPRQLPWLLCLVLWVIFGNCALMSPLEQVLGKLIVLLCR